MVENAQFLYQMALFSVGLGSVGRWIECVGIPKKIELHSLILPEVYNSSSKRRAMEGELFENVQRNNRPQEK